MLSLLIRRSLQTLAMTAVLLAILVAMLPVAVMVMTLVAGWQTENAGIDFAFFGFSKRIVGVVMIFLLAGGAFWASRVFDWRKHA